MLLTAFRTFRASWLWRAPRASRVGRFSARGTAATRPTRAEWSGRRWRVAEVSGLGRFWAPRASGALGGGGGDAGTRPTPRPGRRWPSSPSGPNTPAASRAHSKSAEGGGGRGRRPPAWRRHSAQAPDLGRHRGGPARPRGLCGQRRIRPRRGEDRTREVQLRAPASPAQARGTAQQSGHTLPNPRRGGPPMPAGPRRPGSARRRVRASATRGSTGRRKPRFSILPVFPLPRRRCATC